MENFESKELARVAHELAREEGIHNIQLNKIKNATKNVKSNKDFFKAIRHVDPKLSSFSKGERWGRALWRYAADNLIGKEFGDKTDRLINQIIRIAYQCCSYSYEPTRRECKVDPDTGKLIKR